MDKKLALIIVSCIIIAFALMFLLIGLRKKNDILTSSMRKFNSDLQKIEKDEESDYYQYVKGKVINGQKYDDTLNITPSNCRGLCDSDEKCIGAVYHDNICELYQSGTLSDSMQNDYAYIKTKFMIA
jgi:hypothetical protein